jgi:UDP-N-acetylglucosamine transferase subunit ALG13
MIFVTTGTQFPFDRLLSYVDDWAKTNNKLRIVAQAGITSLKPTNMELYEYLTPVEYKKLIMQAKLIFGHVGTGTMIDAQKYQIPAVLMPRRFELKEHRSEHQIATANQFKAKTGIYIVENQIELIKVLDRLDSLVSPKQENSKARSLLVSFLKTQVTKK